MWGAGVMAASVGFAGLADIQSAVAQSPCAQALALSSKIAPLVTGEVGALTVATRPMQLPDLAFQDAAGAPRKLSDWKGRTVLLNLWATWCVPCRKEVFQDLKSAGLALGMPTSVLVDGAGCEIAAISGGAGWDSDEALRLVTAATTP